jgi:hypothetical protein
MTEVKDIAKSMLKMTDSIVRLKLKNTIAISMYNRFILPFFNKSIDSTPDNEIVKHLQDAYDALKPFFEKKQLQEQIDEGNKLSGYKLQDFGLMKKESKYF